MGNYIKLAAVLTGVGAAMAIGAGAASAVAVTPIPGGTEISLNPAETAAAAKTRLAGPVVDAALPHYVDLDGVRAGDAVQESLDFSAAEDRGLIAKVYGPLNRPSKVDLISRR